MQRFFRDKYDPERLLHFAVAGVVCGLAFSGIDLNKLAERVTVAIAVTSMVRSTAMKPPPGRHEDGHSE